MADIFRVVLGLTFVFSGLVKTVDPWGTALKIAEYSSVYGIAALGDCRFGLAIGLCAAELTMGLMLMFGVKTRQVSAPALVVMSFFLVLTLLSATVLPVGDCGCFGDALKLSPWASVGKNVVLWVLAFVVWRDARRGPALFPVAVREWVLTLLFAWLSVGLGVYCYSHLPIVDFLPYKKGVDLRKATDSANMESDILLRQFVVFDSGGDVTGDILNFPGRVYMLCAARLDAVDSRCAARFESVVRRAEARGEKVVVLTASAIPGGGTTVFGNSPLVPTYNLDATTMATMLRASVGMVTIDDGVIVDKRNCRDIK